MATAVAPENTPAVPPVACNPPVWDSWKCQSLTVGCCMHASRQANADMAAAQRRLTDEHGHGEQCGVAELAPPLLRLPPVVVHKICRSEARGTLAWGCQDCWPQEQAARARQHHRKAGKRTARKICRGTSLTKPLPSDGCSLKAHAFHSLNQVSRACHLRIILHLRQEEAAGVVRVKCRRLSAAAICRACSIVLPTMRRPSTPARIGST